MKLSDSALSLLEISDQTFSLVPRESCARKLTVGADGKVDTLSCSSLGKCSSIASHPWHELLRLQ